MLYEVTGKVVSVLPMVTGTSAKGEWKRCGVVIEYEDGQYVNRLALDTIKKADEISALSIGSEVKFKFSVTSRENNGRWFTSVTAVTWEVLQSTAQPSAKAPF